MIEIERRVSMLPAQPVSVTVDRVRDGSAPDREPAKAELSGWYSRHNGSNAANGRLAGRWPGSGLHAKWSAVIPGDPLALARSTDRIICQWAGAWRLYDSAGHLLQEGPGGQSPVVLDPGTKTFQLITATCSWEVRSLQSGELLYANALPYNESYSWPVVHSSGHRMLAVANVRPPFRHGERDPGSSLIQLLERAGSEAPVNGLVRLSRFEALRTSAEDTRAALSNETLVLAAKDLLMLVDSNLQISAVLTERFRPLFVAMDEAGWIYLLVSIDDRRLLWVFTDKGLRVASSNLPMELAEPIQPPILGYDRRIYLLAQGALLALDPRGHRLWTVPLPDKAVGGGVTLDGQILVTTVKALLQIDPAGNARVVHNFDHSATTPPVFTAQGDVLVGAAEKLICLASGARAAG